MFVLVASIVSGPSETRLGFELVSSRIVGGRRQ